MSLPPNAPSTPASSALAAIEEAQPLCKQWFEAYGTAVYNYFRFHVPLPNVAEDDAVTVLGPADSDLISLRYGSGLEFAEIAEILGVGAGTVRTRLWRALDRLRNALER
jgi:Sigma-70, region 4